MKKKETWGYHLVCDCNGCNAGITHKKDIAAFVTELLDVIKMIAYGEPTIVRFAEHVPQASGYSLVQLIETSAISGHFSDNNGDCYLDIFSCLKFDPQLAMNTIQKHFGPQQMYFQFLEREAKFGLQDGFQTYVQGGIE